MNLSRSVNALSAAQMARTQEFTNQVKARTTRAIERKHRGMIRNVERAVKRWLRVNAKANGAERARAARRAARKARAKGRKAGANALSL